MRASHRKNPISPNEGAGKNQGIISHWFDEIQPAHQHQSNLTSASLSLKIRCHAVERAAPKCQHPINGMNRIIHWNEMKWLHPPAAENDLELVVSGTEASSPFNLIYGIRGKQLHCYWFSAACDKVTL